MVLPLDFKEQKIQIKHLKKVISALKLFITGQVLLTKDDLKTGAQGSVWKNKAMKQTKDKKKKEKFTEALNKEPIRRRQKLMRDLNIFEVIFGIIKHYWDIYCSRWIKVPSTDLDKVEKVPWSLCKY